MLFGGRLFALSTLLALGTFASTGCNDGSLIGGSLGGGGGTPGDEPGNGGDSDSNAPDENGLPRLPGTDLDGWDDYDDDPNDPGLDGGHFDLDTSSQTYAFGDGETDHHVHEYDDKFAVNRVDFFNMVDDKFTTITSRVASGQSFYIVVANAQLSTLTALEINGIRYSTPRYQDNAQQFLNGGGGMLPTFTLDATNPLSEFGLTFRADAINSGGLIATQTTCVRHNEAGAGGEYRDGALTIQILDAATAALDPATGAASQGLLWESTTFWHKDGVDCY